MMIVFYVFIFLLFAYINALFAAGEETRWLSQAMIFGLLAVIFAYMLIKDHEKKKEKKKLMESESRNLEE